MPLDISIIVPERVTESATQTIDKCAAGYRLAHPAYTYYSGGSVTSPFIAMGGEPKADVTYDHKHYDYDIEPVDDKVCIKETDTTKGHD
jgi:hypothetical protein